MARLKIKKLQWATHQQRWFGKWHLYLGIFAGFIIAIVGITGSILVFEDEIDAALNPGLFHIAAGKQKKSFAEIIPLFQKDNPAVHISYVYAPDEKINSPYQVFDYTTEQEYFIDPYTGKLAGKRLYESGFIHTVTEIHRTMLVPVVGRYIVGLSSLVLLILTISGLRLWIPAKWKQLKSVLTVNWKAGFKRKNYDWHNVAGFYSAPVVCLLGLTGFCITFSFIVIPLLFVFSGRSPQGVAKLLGAKSVYAKTIVQLPLTAIDTIMAKELPGGRMAGLAMPVDSVGNFRIDAVSNQLPRSGKREMLILDQYSGNVLLNSRKDFPNVANAYLSWLTPIHFGTFGGMPTRILALLGGLIPAALFITGFIIWYPRWKKKSPAKAVALPEAEKITTAVPMGVYFTMQLKKGLRLASWFVLIAAIMGAVYGLASGIIVQTAAFTIAFTCMTVAINFIVALLGLLFNIIFLLPFRKTSRGLVRYFSLSLGFMAIFSLAYFLLMNTGLHLF